MRSRCRGLKIVSNRGTSISYLRYWSLCFF